MSEPYVIWMQEGDMLLGKEFRGQSRSSFWFDIYLIKDGQVFLRLLSSSSSSSSLAGSFEGHSFCSGSMTYAGIMVSTEDGGELLLVSVDPFDRREAAGGGPCALAGDLLDHDDGEHAWNETLEKMQNICDGLDGVSAV